MSASKIICIFMIIWKVFTLMFLKKFYQVNWVELKDILIILMLQMQFSKINSISQEYNNLSMQIIIDHYMYTANHGNCAIEYCKYSIAILFLKKAVFNMCSLQQTTIFKKWHFSKSYWTKNKKDAFLDKNKNLKKKFFLASMFWIFWTPKMAKSKNPSSVTFPIFI